MLYKKPSFSVPASAGDATMCASIGQHCGPDAKGKCLRCGVKYDVPAWQIRAAEAFIKENRL